MQVFGETFKYTTTFVFCTALGAATFLAACGAFDTKDSGRKVEQADSELTGSWGAPCFDKGFLDFTKRTESYVFSALGDFDRATTIFTDAGCQTAAVTMTVRGTYDALGDAEGGEAKNINFTVSEADITPNAANVVELLNATGYCGVSEWALNKPVSIINKDCLGEAVSQGEVVADIYQLEGEQLRFGSSMIWFDGNDASNRPSALEASVVYTKK